MARGSKEQEQAPDVAADFPYRAVMGHPAWSVLDDALAELESNDDLAMRTARRYVVGYLIQQLIDRKLTPPAFAVGPEAGGAPAPDYQWVLQMVMTDAATLPRRAVKKLQTMK